MDRLEKSPKEVVSPELQKVIVFFLFFFLLLLHFQFVAHDCLKFGQSLLLLEEQEGSVNFKFGVLYAKAGQASDDEMFSNGTFLCLFFS